MADETAQPSLYGENLFGEAIEPEAPNLIAERFLYPPFTVLNARDGFWRDRKRAWKSLGIKGEVGRGVGAFVADTINAFRAVGLELYNEAILVTPAGSLPVRITKQFEVSRKMGKTHQNVLVFVRGDWRKAVSALAGVSRYGREDLPCIPNLL